MLITAKLEIRRLQKIDIPKIIKIEEEAFSNPWSKEVFLKELNNEKAYYIVGLYNNDVVAYLGTWLFYQQAHMTNLATAKDYRRQGFASQILSYLYLQLRLNNIERISLEVRVSNKKAQQLYKREGFIKVGIKESYYSDNNEDAVLMWKRIYR